MAKYIYKKLVLLKDLPDIPMGSSCHVRIDEDKDNYCILTESGDVNQEQAEEMIAIKDNADFILIIDDYSHGLSGILCGNCNNETMLPAYDWHHEYDDGVHYCYIDNYLFCAKCGHTTEVNSVMAWSELY